MIALMIMVKMVNLISGLVMERRLVMLHTAANKVAGLVVFIVLLALPFLDIAIPAIPACAIATFAAVQEGHFIRTGRVETIE